ncbi:MAG: chemotaxis protein MotB [Deltaproteobacteria bacterium]|nr:MAG: chemotaxis protein MotB [Deltaproteobacteria bacterium]
MVKKAVLAALVAALAIGLSACSVMQGTYQKKVDEADTLSKRLAALQKKHDDLSAENSALKTRNERLISDLAGMTLQRDKLTTDLAYVTGQRDKLSADKEELEKVLQAKSDTLSRNIFELRRKVADLETENGKLKRENAGLQKALDEKTRRVADLEREAEGLRKAKEEEVRKTSSTYESLMEKMKKEISAGQVTISELKGKLTVNMVDSILFDSGKAEVKEGGLAVLDKVISILRDVKDKSIRIEGHTDNVQIVGALAKKYPTNWELSAARAINVTRFLQQQGIDPAQLSAVGYGEYKPVGDNAAPEGRAKNRRIEINLVPRE